jgi:hypothetical protein
MDPSEKRTIKDEASQLGLTSSVDDLDALRFEIKVRISERDPDHAVNYSEDRLQRLTELLRRAGSEGNGLMHISRRQLVLRENAISAQREPVETRIEIVRESSKQSSNRGFLLPKLSLGAVTAILG